MKEAQKEKIRKSNKKTWANIELRREQSIRMMGNENALNSPRMLGKHQTEEWCENQSKFMQGKQMALGRKVPDNEREMRSIIRKEYLVKHPEEIERLGKINIGNKHSLGREQPDEEIEGRRQALIQHYIEHPEDREKLSGLIVAHYDKVGRKVSMNRANDGLLYMWHRAVIKRDKHTCQDCGTTQGKMIVHHIRAYSTNIEERYNVDNGVCLCVDCAKKIDKYMRGKIID